MADGQLMPTFLEVAAPPRRRSWRTEEENRKESHLYVNLPERSSSFGGSEVKVQVESCTETTGL